MENIRIGIIAGDNDYAMALASGITEIRRDMIVDILPPSGKRYGDEHDLLLIEEQLAHDAAAGNAAGKHGEGPLAAGNISGGDAEGKTIVLCREKEDRCLDRLSGTYRLWRYSNIREIVSSIIYIYTIVYDRHIPYVEKDNVRFYGFFSHAGGTGCTTVAMGAAQELSRFHGRNVMYVSMEQISSASEYMNSESDGRTVAEYLYHCLGRNQDVWHMEEVPVESFLARNEWGVESLTASPGRNPVPYLDRKDIPAFFSSIVKSGRYDTVVLDAGCTLAAQATDALDLCDSCCFVRDPERLGKKAELYADHLFSVLGSGIRDHMVIVDNRQTSYKEDERSRILDELFSDEEEDAAEKRMRRTDRNSSEDGKERDGLEAGNDEPGPAWRTADVIIERNPSSFRKDNGKTRIISDRDFGAKMKELTKKLIAAAGDS